MPPFFVTALKRFPKGAPLWMLFDGFAGNMDAWFAMGRNAQ